MALREGYVILTIIAPGSKNGGWRLTAVDWAHPFFKVKHQWTVDIDFTYCLQTFIEMIE